MIISNIVHFKWALTLSLAREKEGCVGRKICMSMSLCVSFFSVFYTLILGNGNVCVAFSVCGADKSVQGLQSIHQTD